MRNGSHNGQDRPSKGPGPTVCPAGHDIRTAETRAGKQHLEMKDNSIDVTAEAVGYSDPRPFRRLFKRMTGLTPAEYRRRFSSRGFLAVR